MSEPFVTITDYMIAVECAILAIMSRGFPHGWSRLFFGSISSAALLGGTVHGFPDALGPEGIAFFWIVTMILMGVMAMAAWAIGARVVLRTNALEPQIQRQFLMGNSALFAVYVFIVLFVDRRFGVAVAYYISSAIFLLVVLYRRSALAFGGLFLTLLASAVQQARVSLGPLDYNALYHVMEMFGLFCLFLGWNKLSVEEKEP